MIHCNQETITRHQITTAIGVITNPAHFCETPQHFATAWQTLKAARGESVDLAHIGPAVYRVDAEPAPASSLSGMSRACLERLRAHVARKPAPMTSTVYPTDGGAA